MYGQRLLVCVMASVMLVVVGCGQALLEKGERLVTTQEMKVSGESVWEDGTTEAFTSVVPAGTVFEMIYTQRPGLEIIEVVPVEVENVADSARIAQHFLPPHLQNRFGFKRYSMTLDVADLGTKYKREEKGGA